MQLAAILPILNIASISTVISLLYLAYPTSKSHRQKIYEVKDIVGDPLQNRSLGTYHTCTLN